MSNEIKIPEKHLIIITYFFTGLVVILSCGLSYSLVLDGCSIWNKALTLFGMFGTLLILLTYIKGTPIKFSASPKKLEMSAIELPTESSE